MQKEGIIYYNVLIGMLHVEPTNKLYYILDLHPAPPSFNPLTTQNTVLTPVWLMGDTCVGFMLNEGHLCGVHA